MPPGTSIPRPGAGGPDALREAVRRDRFARQDQVIAAKRAALAGTSIRDILRPHTLDTPQEQRAKRERRIAQRLQYAGVPTRHQLRLERLRYAYKCVAPADPRLGEIIQVFIDYYARLVPYERRQFFRSKIPPSRALVPVPCALVPLDLTPPHIIRQSRTTEIKQEDSCPAN